MKASSLHLSSHMKEQCKVSSSWSSNASHPEGSEHSLLKDVT